MNMDRWLDIIKNCSRAFDNRLIGLKVYLTKDFSERKLVYQDIELLVKFDKDIESLTVFEGDLLVHVFGYGQLPTDYAQYHNCIAGEKFIESIAKKLVAISGARNRSS